MSHLFFCPSLFRRAAPSSRLQQVQHCSSSGLTAGPPSHDARRWMRKGRGRISLPMLACHAAAAASQPPNLEIAATPACSQHARRRQQFEILSDPLSGASCSQCRAPMLQSSLLIPQTWSVPVIEQPRLGSNIRHPSEGRQTFSIGLCVCVKGLHCVPPQVSASQFSPPIGQFIQSTTSPGRYRPPDLAVSRSALGLAGLTSLTRRGASSPGVRFTSLVLRR